MKSAETDSTDQECGQILISVALMLSLFLIGVVGLSVDGANLWFQRQAAQTAADAACLAGAMDISAEAAGMNLTKTGFTAGSPGNCESDPGGTICFYANANGFNGAGLTAGESSAVSWSFPASVAGVTAPPASVAGYPFLRVVVTENVKTYLVSVLDGSHFQQVSASATCGLVQDKEAAPMLVLNPTASGTFTYSGGGKLTIIGGPQRSLQVNSSNPQAVNWAAYNTNAVINTSKGGPNGSGSDVAVTGGPTTGGGGFIGGSTGKWLSGSLPITDPYAGVGPPTSIKSLVPITGTSGTWVSYGQDGCPDNRTSHYPTTNQCIEFGPGYYPNGIQSLDGWSTAIFLPGIYYMNGSLVAGNSEYIRNATPCSPKCGPLTSGTTWQQTDGVMFYFLTGSLNFSGCSGCGTSIDPVPSTRLTCDGSQPNANLNMPAQLNGNLLVAQCTQNGTYWDPGGDTSDSRGAPGTRGLLVYQAHSNTTQPQMGASGSLSFSGALYFHSSSYADILSISGAASSGTFILGQIVTDQVNLSGSGAINLSLNPLPSTEMLKVALLQ